MERKKELIEYYQKELVSYQKKVNILIEILELLAFKEVSGCFPIT